MEYKKLHILKKNLIYTLYVIIIINTNMNLEVCKIWTSKNDLCKNIWKILHRINQYVT